VRAEPSRPRYGGAFAGGDAPQPEDRLNAASLLTLMAPRRPAAASNSGAAPAEDRDAAATQAKLSDLVAGHHFSQALRVREQALRRHPDWILNPTAAQLWCLQGRQSLEQQQPGRAETAFRQALELDPAGEALLWLARLRLQQQQPQQALALLEEAFEAERLPPELSGAYLKLLLLQGQEQQLRALLREQPKRFQNQQLHWAAGVISLLDGDPIQAKRQFDRMIAPASPGDPAGLWRAWALREAGDAGAAAAAIQGIDHPAAAALALDLAAAGDEHPATLLGGLRRHPPAAEQRLSLELLHHLRRERWLQAAELLLVHERSLRSALPELAVLRRPLLRLAGQQALDQGTEEAALRCWRAIVDRPSLDPDLALRLYPLLMQGDNDDVTEAERLAGLLLGWLRRAARDAPADWPQPQLTHSLARLHCWQANAQMRLGMRQQARRSVEQARQLAPDHPDVSGSRGLLATLQGANDTAIPLLWQAIEAGCSTPVVFEALQELLEYEERLEERQRLLQEHGSRFGITAPPAPEAEDSPPDWLLALTEADATAMGITLNRGFPPGSGAGVEALRIFCQHIGGQRGGGGNAEPAVNPRKVNLELEPADRQWDALLATLSPVQQVEALTAMAAAILRFCRRNGKTTTAALQRRLLQLEQHLSAGEAASAEQAGQALLLLLGLRLRRGESPEQSARRLLRDCPQPERQLPLALLDLRLLSSTRPWQGMVVEMQRHDPDNPLLSLARATMEPFFSSAYQQFSQQAFEQARRQQDRQALAACHRAREMADFLSAAGRKSRRGGGDSWPREGFDPIEFATLLRRIVEEEWMRRENDSARENDSDVDAPPPPPGRTGKKMPAREAGEQSQQPPPSGSNRRRTFKDL